MYCFGEGVEDGKCGDEEDGELAVEIEGESNEDVDGEEDLEELVEEARDSVDMIDLGQVRGARSLGLAATNTTFIYLRWQYVQKPKIRHMLFGFTNVCIPQRLRHYRLCCSLQQCKTRHVKYPSDPKLASFQT